MVGLEGVGLRLQGWGDLASYWGTLMNDLRFCVFLHQKMQLRSTVTQARFQLELWGLNMCGEVGTCRSMRFREGRLLDADGS